MATVGAATAVADVVSRGEALYHFVQIKAYGDLTIAASAVRQVPREMRHRVGLVIAPHLRELTAVLAPGCTIEVLRLRDRGIPARFDPAPRGRLARWWSTIALRRALAPIAPGTTLVMRHLGPVHRRILGRRVAEALPVAPNLYEAYAQFLTATLGPFTAAMPTDAVPRVARVAICPSSRVPYKCLPDAMVEIVAACCRSAGVPAEIVLLDGERVPPAGILPSRVLPRRFDAMWETLATYAAVVSADSFPAHLAEYQGTPVFVVSPHANEYWLPGSAWRHGAWGTFGAPDALAERLRSFLTNRM
jgi:hypothetical protein